MVVDSSGRQPHVDNVAHLPDGREAAAQEPQPRLFTVDEYHKMAEAGILRPDEKVQLIEGKIVSMPPIGPRHSFRVTRLSRMLTARVGDNTDIRSQNPIRLANGAEPEPDVAVVTI